MSADDDDAITPPGLLRNQNAQWLWACSTEQERADHRADLAFARRFWRPRAPTARHRTQSQAPSDPEPT